MKNLFKRKRSAERVEPQPPAAKEWGLLGLTLLPTLLVLLLFALAAYGGWRQYLAMAEGRLAEHEQTEAHRLAAHMGGRVAALGEQAGWLAQSDDELDEIIYRMDREALPRREQALLARHPSLLQARYIFPTDREPEPGEGLRLGYASLELARRAELGELPPVEVHRSGTEEAYLAVARALKQRGEVSATLLLMLDPQLPQQWLREAGLASGLVELRQDDSTVLFQQGRQSDTRADAYRVPIVGTPWAIHYWPHETGVLDSDGQLQFIAAFALAAGLLALILVFYGLVLSRMVRADILRLVDAIIDGSRGKRSHGWPVKLAESRAVLHAREGELRVLHYGDESSQRPTVAGEVEMPDILFGSEDDIQVDEASDQADSPDRRE